MASSNPPPPSKSPSSPDLSSSAFNTRPENAAAAQHRLQAPSSPPPLISTTQSGSHETLAPLGDSCRQQNFSLVSGGYIVYLRPGHSLAQHSAAVGKDMAAQHVQHVYDRLYPEKVVYVGRDIDDELLRRVREDKGVEMVDCDTEPEIEGGMGEGE